MGLICFVHQKTKEVKSVMDLNHPDADAEIWIETWEEIEKDMLNFIRIDPMSSREAFQIMEDFAESVTNNRMRNRLHDALSRNKPFSRFKDAVDNGGYIRQQWFDFKQQRYEDWVRAFIQRATR
ncbi:MAG: UPF0158 family protein [Bacteroidota bacterium]